MTSSDDKPIVPVRLVYVNGDEVVPEGGGPADGGPDLRPVDFSDDALALALSFQLGPDWRYVPATGEWYRWTGQRWEPGALHRVLNVSRRVCREIALTCENLRLARQVSSKSVIYAAAKLTGDDPRHATELDVFDKDPWLLNTPAGVADLRTGKILPARREQMMSHITAAAPGGAAPHFMAFLRQITQGNGELEAYLKRVVGYCHTGSVEEHAMFFIHGPPRNGKTTFVEMLADSVGDYAVRATMDIFTIAKGERHPEELAIFAGKRLVTATETTKGKPWDEGRLKVLTGGDRVRARFMRSNSFEFPATWKLLLAGNHRPPMRQMDAALRARMNLIPFRHPTIPEGARDKKLMEKLRAELGGFLQWAIEGALEWREKGLAPPAVVVKATDEYFRAEDVLGRWIAERCMEDIDEKAATGLLYRDYQSWARTAGEFAISLKRFSEDLEDHGYRKSLDPKTRQSRFHGIKPLLSPEELPLDAPRGGGARQHDYGGAEPWRGDPGDDFPRE